MNQKQNMKKCKIHVITLCNEIIFFCVFEFLSFVLVAISIGLILIERRIIHAR